MDHVAIMKKEWRFIEKILSGEKTIESRWYNTKYKPWNAIKKGDAVYFKNSSEVVNAKAEVKNVIQFFKPEAEKILNEYGARIGIEKKDIAKFLQKFRGKNYCTLIFLENAKKVKPFNINKKGFGAMASWITVNNVYEIQ